MKKILFISAFTLPFFTSTAFGQDIPQSQVPSLVVNSFHQTFAKALGVEWELEGDLYKVEFETGLLGVDHEVWYEKTGKVIRHKEEISKNDLPKKVLAAINAKFGGYYADDVEKMTEGSNTTYKVDLKKITEEWKVLFDSDGNILSKISD